jgi:hypothetical protein
VTAGLSFLALIFVEMKIAYDPIIPPRIFKNWNVVIMFLENFFKGMCFFSFIFFGPIYFQILREDSATLSGLQLLPLLLGLVVFAIVSTVVLPLVKSYQILLLLGNAMLSAGCFWFGYFLNEGSTRASEIGALLIAGVGLGFSIQTSILCAQSSISQKDTATVSGLVGFFQSIGGAIGLAIMSAVFNDKVKQGLAGLPVDILEFLAGLAADAEASGGSSEFSPTILKRFPDEVKGPVVGVYLAALQQVFRVAAPFGVVAFVVCLLVRKSRVLGAAEIQKSGPGH